MSRGRGIKLRPPQRARRVTVVPLKEALPAMRAGALTGVIRALDLRQRVTELVKKRGWPVDDDVIAVMCAIIACEKLGAGGEPFRRPPLGELCGGKWPEGSKPAWFLVQELELDDMLVT